MIREIEFSARVQKQYNGKLVIEILDNEQSKFEDMIDVPVAVNITFSDIEGWIEGV